MRMPLSKIAKLPSSGLGGYHVPCLQPGTSRDSKLSISWAVNAKMLRQAMNCNSLVLGFGFFQWLRRNKQFIATIVKSHLRWSVELMSITGLEGLEGRENQGTHPPLKDESIQAK
jgi:hypothetical protein